MTRRLPSRKSASGGATVLIVLALTACGGGSGSEAISADAGVGAVFAAKARSVCKSALAEKQTWRTFPVPAFNPTAPDPSALPKVATWLDQEVAPTFEKWHDGLLALGEPPTNTQAWHDVIHAVTTIELGNQNQITAARAGDADAFKASTQALHDAQTDLVAATDAAGVPSCAAVHAS